MARVEATAEQPAEAPNRTPLAQLGLCEALLTAFLLFGIVTIVRWTLGPSAISDHVTGLHGRLALVGLAVAFLLIAIMLFPLSRVSGAHMNPAISVAMWRYGLLSRAAVLCYIIGQLVGSICGVLVGRLTWGPGHPVRRWEPHISSRDRLRQSQRGKR